VKTWLKTQRAAGIRVLESRDASVTLIDEWMGASTVFLIDAVVSGAAAGTIHRLAVGAQPLSQRMSCHSSHAFGLKEIIELARALNRLPRNLIVYGIEGKNFAEGSAPSPEVITSAADVGARVLSEVMNSASQLSP
jgi:hydrogenase maturation protease